jgi:hypothetical protein
LKVSDFGVTVMFAPVTVRFTGIVIPLSSALLEISVIVPL